MSRKFRGWAKQNRARQQAEVLSPTSAAPISNAKLAANRANAQLSTGAITEIGKATVALNATKHGLTGKFRVAPDESQEDFDRLLAAFMRDEAPADQEEIQYVQYMAEATWLSRRAVRLQDQAVIAIQNGTPEEQKEAKKDLALYLRYMSAHDRAYFRYATELRKRRNERARTERGFVSQKHKEAAEDRRIELHQLRRERIEINNRIALGRAERLEIENQRKRQPKIIAAAA